MARVTTADAGGLADCAAVSAGSVSQAALAPAPWLAADGTGSSWARSVRVFYDMLLVLTAMVVWLVLSAAMVQRGP